MYWCDIIVAHIVGMHGAWVVCMGCLHWLRVYTRHPPSLL